MNIVHTFILFSISAGQPAQVVFGKIRKVAAALARQFGLGEKGARYHLFPLLSVLLVSGNSALLPCLLPQAVCWGPLARIFTARSEMLLFFVYCQITH